MIMNKEIILNCLKNNNYINACEKCFDRKKRD